MFNFPIKLHHNVWSYWAVYLSNLLLTDFSGIWTTFDIIFFCFHLIHSDSYNVWVRACKTYVKMNRLISKIYRYTKYYHRLDNIKCAHMVLVCVPYQSFSWVEANFQYFKFTNYNNQSFTLKIVYTKFDDIGGGDLLGEYDLSCEIGASFSFHLENFHVYLNIEFVCFCHQHQKKEKRRDEKTICSPSYSCDVSQQSLSPHSTLLTSGCAVISPLLTTFQ